MSLQDPLAPFLYLRTRRRMMAGGFVWESGSEKALVLIGNGYLADDEHVTLADVVSQARTLMSPLSGVYTTSDAWGASIRAMFVGLDWPEPVYYAALVERLSPGVDPSSFALLAYFGGIIGGPYTPRNEDVAVYYNLNEGAGWLRP